MSDPSLDSYLEPIDHDTDLAVRTVYGEAANQPTAGQQAVISTAVNRARASGQPLATVLKAPHQYQVWDNPALAAKANVLKPSDPAYQAIEQTIRPVLSGEVSTPYTHYLNPKTAPADASARKTWAAQPGEPIGDHEFYTVPTNPAEGSGGLDSYLGDPAGGEAVKPSGEAAQSFLSGVGGAGDEKEPPQAEGQGTVGQFLANVAKPTAQKLGHANIVRVESGPHQGEPYTQAQEDAFLHGMPTESGDIVPLDPEAPKGSKYHPYGMLKDSAVPSKPGDYYLTQDGVLKQVPLSAEEQKTYAKETEFAKENFPPALSAAVNGLTQGFLPEISGVGADLMGDHADAHMRRMVQAEKLSEYRQAHPLSNALLTDTGSLASGALATEGLGNVLNMARVPQALGPVGRFAAGQAGDSNSAGNALLQAGSRTAQNAGQGAAMGLMASHLNPNESIGSQTAAGALGGAAIGAAARGARLAGNVVGEHVPVVRSGNNLLNRFSQSGRERIADQALQEFAQGGPTALNVNELVPGSRPTLAQATGNPGLLAAQRAARDMPEVSNLFRGREADQAAAQATHLEALRGDNDSLNDMISARSEATAPLREAAFAGAKDVNPQPVLDAIDQILASPEGKRDAVRNVMANIRSKISDADGNLERDPAQLYGVRQAIGDLYSTADRDSAKLASKQLNSVKGVLDGVIEEGAPGFKDYLKQFSDASDPISEKKFLLGRALTDGQGRPTLAKVQRALDAIEAGDRAPGVNGPKAVSAETRDGLKALRDDLARSNIMPDRSAGSNTFEKLQSNQLLGKLNMSGEAAGVLHPVAGITKRFIDQIYAGQNRKISSIFYNKLLNPEYGASAFAAPKPMAPGPNGLLFPSLGQSPELSRRHRNQLVGGGVSVAPAP